MKKITSILLVIGLGIISAQAGNHFPVKATTPAAVENNFRNALWFNSQNRAGLAFDSLNEYNVLDLRYDLGKGEFRPQTTGKSMQNISLNTNGAVKLGKFLLWGDFSFRNIFENGTKYNAILYEVEEDMPYFILDDNVSNWNKQEYELAASLTSPAVADIISFGLKVQYHTKVGAKQKDPRCETYKYNIEVVPSAAIQLGRGHLLGLYGLFDNNFERSVPSLNNYMESPKVTYNKGMGEGIIGKVGGNDGLKTIFYKGMNFGGGLQYAYHDQTSVLADFGYIRRKIDGFEHPSLPKRLGSTASNDIIGNIQLIFGNEKSNKFTLDGMFSSTKGTEHIQKLNTDAEDQRWEIVTSNKMTSFSRICANLSYDHLFGNDEQKGYDWKIGGNADFSHRNYTYATPQSTYTATSVLMDLNGGKQFKFRSSSLLLTLEAGYKLTLGGDYNYGGSKKESIQVEYYENENNYLTTDYLKSGARISYTINTEKINYFIDLKGDWFKPISINGSRLVCCASLGIVF